MVYSVGDVFKEMAPFLKMYKTYIENFDIASALMTQYMTKSSAFAALIKECESDPRCRGLGMYLCINMSCLRVCVCCSVCLSFFHTLVCVFFSK